MSDWQKGDLALCVDDDPCPVHPGSEGGIRKGGVYTVLEVRAVAARSGVVLTGLRLDRHNPIHPVSGAEGYQNCQRFVKITPPKADEFDREVIDLMVGGKVPA